MEPQKTYVPAQPLPPPLLFLKRCLAHHYREHPPPLPDRFGRREFGFVGWPREPGPPPFVRHVGFRTREEYTTFLRRRAPWHLYYSTAFYQKPTERRMVDKGWLGAELVFDLDADHLPDADQMDFGQQMAAVKKEFHRLLDEFVLGDLGYDAKDVRINFSGGRGYHCHVLAPDAMALEARQRRQIADYVTGKGVEERELVTVSTHRIRDRGMVKESRHLVIPKPDENGWKGRVGRGVVRFLEELVELPRAEAKKRLQAYPGVGAKTADRFLDRLRDDVRDDSGRNLLDRMRSGSGDQGTIFAQVLGKEAVRKEMVRLEEGETDEPVTADTKRLIRMPESLHGKTGLRVVPLTLDGLKDFDPLKHAVALSWQETDVVLAPKEARFELMDERFVLPENDPIELPRAAAFFAVARRLATVPSDEQ